MHNVTVHVGGCIIFQKCQDNCVGHQGVTVYEAVYFYRGDEGGAKFTYKIESNVVFVMGIF